MQSFGFGENRRQVDLLIHASARSPLWEKPARAQVRKPGYPTPRLCWGLGRRRIRYEGGIKDLPCRRCVTINPESHFHWNKGKAH